MNVTVVTIIFFLIGLPLAFAWFKRNKNRGTSEENQSSQSSGHLAISKTEPSNATPNKVVIMDGNQKIMSITLMEHADATDLRLREAVQLPQQSITSTIHRLIEPLMQVAPSIGTAVAANNGRLMEVVINGQMLAASDGNGYRAIAIAPNGFEHGRLHEPKNLQKSANAAAIWQIASVIVAQKHLADISATLQRVESKLDGIQDFLEESRRAIIKSAMNYLEAAKNAIESGEFLERTRNELERFDIELDRADMNLKNQIKQQSKQTLQRDAIGCEGDYKSALNRHKKLGQLTDELILCQEVRLAIWYLCSLYPDQSKMLTHRLVKVKETFAESIRLKDDLFAAMGKDFRSIDSKFTSGKVISERRAAITLAAQRGTTSLLAFQQRSESIHLKIESVRADSLETNSLIVNARDGEPLAVYLCPNHKNSDRVPEMQF